MRKLKPRKFLIKAITLTLTFIMLISASGCSLVEELLGPSHEHSYTQKFDIENHWQECECGEKKDEQKHVWGLGVTTIEPTLQSAGEKTFTCDCGATKKEEIPKLLPSTGEFSIHFLTLGNDYAGDCVYIKAGDVDILIDGGSRANSVDDITDYVDQYVEDGKIEYVIVTHADQDHIACFGITDGSLFDYYECGVIIDFPLSDKTTKVYERYQSERADEVMKGAKHFTALECYNQSKEGAERVYQLDDGISMEILYNYYYENQSSDENNYSVCLQFVHGSRKFLFTGDLEKEGEEYLVEHNDLGQVELFKAGHHGSKTSSNDCLLDVIQPKICVVTCSAGTDEYTDTLANQFPTQAFIDRISKHTDKVYVTTLGDNEFTGGAEFIDMNGDIIISSTIEGVEVICSNNSTLLKDTDWFKAERICPQNWIVN
jgi:beta-lactamase superfamily II metal-dependent hydrolase